MDHLPKKSARPNHMDMLVLESAFYRIIIFSGFQYFEDFPEAKESPIYGSLRAAAVLSDAIDRMLRIDGLTSRGNNFLASKGKNIKE